VATLQRGRAFVAPIEVTDIRVLSREDLNVLKEKRPQVQLQSIRDQHHRVARAIAAGLSNTEVAAVCGISYNRVSMLKADPAMIELIAHYRSIITADYVQANDPVNDFLSTIRTKSLAMIEEKIDAASEAGEFLPSRDLAAFAELGLDRTGYGKVNKNLNVNMDLGKNLENAINKTAKLREVRTIEAPRPTQPQSVPGGESRSAPLVRRVLSPSPIAASFRRL